MPREVDERKKRAALRKLRRAADLAAQGLGPPLTDWEAAFLEEVEARVEKYGSAFADPTKGAEGEALSGLQQAKLRQIDKKARGKEPKGLKARKPMGMKRRPVREAQPEMEDEVPPPAPPPPRAKPALVPAAGLPSASNVTPLRKAKPRLTVIEGGGKKTEN
ncbi:MAG TPA: hypothetical protein PKV67_04420 [Hyphomonas sp.]|nr:hypothetical protein [Hyphomonas sp.]HRK69742.1 hypothetical protein [Hyphomonas sp.]